MTEFGQTLPAVPRIYATAAQFSFTKTGLTSHICRALTTVGMVPITQWWPYDALDPANAEIVLTQGVNSTSTYIFPFDFPDASTFSINNELWRPFIAVVAYYGNVSSATSSGQQNDYFRVDLGIRRDGAASMVDTRGRWRQFTANQFGWGNQGDTATINGAGGIGDYSRGNWIFKPDWKPWGSAAFTDNSTLSVRNIFIYLGAAGLFVYLGTGQTKDLFGSIMSAGFAFGGARLPDRGAVLDPNLGRICPVVVLPMAETTLYNGTTGLLRTIMPCMQHDLTFTLNWVNANFFNLENAEIPFYPALNPNTLNSPRRLSSGQGAHILGRAVIIPKEISFGTTLFGPVNAKINANDTRPTFAEVFACPRFRFADLTAPMGDYQDPDTLDNWRMVPHPVTGMMLGLYSENATNLSTLTVGNKTLLETRSYPLTSTTQTGTGAFPVGSPVTVPSSPVGMSAAIAHLTIPGGASTSRWTSPGSGTDLFTCDMTAFTANADLDCVWSFTPPLTDPLDSTYELKLDLRVRGGAEDTNNLQIQQTLNGVQVALAMSDGVTTRTLFATAGANTSHYAWNYVTYTASIVRDISQTTGPIQIRFRANRSNASDATVIEVKAVQVRRYRYV